MPGDLLLLNGRIRTMDVANPAVSAVAIRIGRVVYAGDDAGAKAAAAPGSPVIDLAGRSATPGLNDAPAHPVVLIRMCHHIGVANSPALRLAGITGDTPDPADGLFDRDEHGEPTGVLREGALSTVRALMPEPDEDAMMTALEAGGREFLRQGVTSTVEAGIGDPRELRAYQRLREAGHLPVRTYLMMMLDETLDDLISLGIS